MVLLANGDVEQTIARGLARGCELVGLCRDPLVALLPADGEGSAGRGGGAVASADGSRRPGPPGRLRAVELAARRLAGPSADQRDRARGDRRDRRPGDADAGDPAGGAVETQRALRDRGALQ